MSHDHDAPPAPVERRVAALEELLTARGLVPPGFVDDINRRYENDVGPMNGAKVVARAWVDPDYTRRLLADSTAAIAELGIGGDEGEHMQVCENTATVHNVVVCTLCSCYPWPVLGLPPAWYKDPPYRARMVREPRVLLAEMGCEIGADVQIQVWDSSAEHRYLVLPQRPAGTDKLSQDELHSGSGSSPPWECSRTGRTGRAGRRRWRTCWRHPDCCPRTSSRTACAVSHPSTKDCSRDEQRARHRSTARPSGVDRLAAVCRCCCPGPTRRSSAGPDLSG